MILKNSFILMHLCFSAENLPVFLSIVVYFFFFFFSWSVCCCFMDILGLAILYWFCKKPKYLSSHCIFKQAQMLLPSAPFNRKEFEIKFEFLSVIAIRINFLGLRLFFF